MTILSKHLSPHTKILYVTGVISDKFINDLNQCLFNPHCNRFTELNFRKTHLSSVQAKTLFNALRNNTALDRLDLSSNPINSSLEELANILPSTNIKELILSETGITDQDLTNEFFASILKSNVKYLDLSYNPFGKAGVARMIEKLFNSKIDKVELQGSRNITPQIANNLAYIINNECKKYPLQICSSKKSIWINELYKYYYTGYIDTSFWIDPDTTTQDTFSENILYQVTSTDSTLNDREGWNSSLVDKTSTSMSTLNSTNSNLVQEITTPSLDSIIEKNILPQITISNSTESSNTNLVHDVTTDNLNPIVEISSDSVLPQITIRSIDKQLSTFESDINNYPYSPYLFQQLSLQELIIGAGFVIGSSLGILGSIIIHKYCHHSSKSSSDIEMLEVSTPILEPAIVI